MENRWVALGAALVAFAAIALAAGFALPDSWRVERSMEIGATPPIVFELVDSSAGWVAWAGDLVQDPTVSLVPVEGPRAGAGSRVRWVTDETVVATLTVRESEPYHRVSYDLEWANGVEVDGEFILEPRDAGTQVTWVARGELGNNPIARWMGFLMGPAVGEGFDEGLGRLATEAERRAVAHGPLGSPSDPTRFQEAPIRGGGASFEGP